MAYNGSGTFNITTAGQPVVTGTVISSTAFNALTADLATGLSTCVTKDGQTATTARVPFAFGISSTLTTDATSATTGSIITAGGISTQKALWVGTTSRHVGATQFDAAITYGGITLSNAVTGTGNMVLSASPTLTGTLTAAAITASGAVTLSSTLTFGGVVYTNATGTAGALPTSVSPTFTGTVNVAALAATGNISIANGQYFKAARNSGSNVINVLGFATGTDDLELRTSNALIFTSTGPEYGRFNPAGELLLGTTTDSGAYLLQVNSQIFATNATIATSDLIYKDVLLTTSRFEFDGKVSGTIFSQAMLKDIANDIPSILYQRNDRPQDGVRAGYGAQHCLAVLERHGYREHGIVQRTPSGMLLLDEGAIHTLKIAALESRITNLEKAT